MDEDQLRGALYRIYYAMKSGKYSRELAITVATNAVMSQLDDSTSEIWLKILSSSYEHDEKS